MQAAAAKITNNEGAAQPFSSKYKPPTTEAENGKLRRQFSHLINKALAADAALAPLRHQMNQQRQQAKKAMLTALYGAEYAQSVKGKITAETTDLEPDGPNFPMDAKTDRDSNSKTAAESGKKASATLATDTVCLCTGYNGSTTTLCTQNAVSGLQDIGAANARNAKALGNWQKLKAECAKGAAATGKINLETALFAETATFLSLLGTGAINAGTRPTTLAKSEAAARTFYGAFVLENTDSPACTSQSGTRFQTAQKRVCIDYAAVLKPGKQIRWLAAIDAAAMHLQTLSSTFKHCLRFISQAESVKTQMESLLLMRDLFAVHGAETASTGANRQPTAEKQNKCKAATNKTVEGCSAIDCDYDAKTQECKPKA
uniref:Variant surface glycoprotein 1125.5132 n=1 Tax=Trypanosoma brucei TaxID=5691 RepID=A0A1J0RBU3_9TRYP|nr:variant surface glycoprotein 1125.5132 [Trypanosoma brucei]